MTSVRARNMTEKRNYEIWYNTEMKVTMKLLIISIHITGSYINYFITGSLFEVIVRYEFKVISVFEKNHITSLMIGNNFAVMQRKCLCNCNYA